LIIKNPGDFPHHQKIFIPALKALKTIDRQKLAVHYVKYTPTIIQLFPKIVTSNICK